MIHDSRNRHHLMQFSINLKKYIFQLISKNLGQLFRKEIKIENLPPMSFSSRKSYHDIMDNKDEAGIAKMFTTSS